MTSLDRLATAFLRQAASCQALGSPFMARLMEVLAGSWLTDTMLAARLARWSGEIGPQGASLPLRVAGGLHALVLSKRDADLAAVYPPHVASDQALRDAVLAALRRWDGFLLDWVARAPQTNEVRRSAVLIAVAHWLTDRIGLPLQLSELGASAGLNLMFDRYALEISGQRRGPQDAALTLTPDWHGPLPPLATPEIVVRRGVDLNPLRAGNPEDELRLLACLWPDQPERMARTRAALAIQTAAIDKGDAIDWLEQRLADPLAGRLHLIFHTVAWQYFPPEAQARGARLMAQAGARATDAAPLAWFGMEDDGGEGAALVLRLWPGNLTIPLGRAGFHGQWIRWRG